MILGASPAMAQTSRAGDEPLAPQEAVPEQEPVDPHCALPTPPTVLLERDGVVLWEWSLPALEIFFQPVLPPDSGLLAYRAAIRADGADLRRPVADEPAKGTEAEEEIWRNERFNNDLAYSGEVGTIQPITCLDALLFAAQDARFSELDHPTEFLASVLRRGVADDARLVVVFGAGNEMFPPKEVYGFDVVDRYLADGWIYWYALHNHTIQRNGESLALGTPVPSTSDVQLTRNLAAGRGLEGVRVTNGFYTFSASVDGLAAFRSR